MVERIIDAASEHGAATVAMPLKFTVKEAKLEGQVVRTLERSALWEVQTPQIMQLDLLHKGFDYAYQHNLTVTDDTSLIELLGAKVQLVEGSDRNIKLTTPEDFAIAQTW
jgi:2-C-methyl-D-erythritol 4-phosphate cytidylyltransferase